MKCSETKVVVGYCRVSTENQREEGTIEIQEIALKDYARQNNLELVAVFKDDGISGSREPEERKGYIDLLDYLDLHPEVSGIIIYKLDRLARDLRAQENTIHDIQNKRNKQLTSIKEPDLDSKDLTRVLMRQILGSFAEYEKKVITSRLTDGRIKKAKKGGYAGGAPAIGYKVHGKELKVDSKHRETVQYIFNLKAQKKGLREIARILNNEGRNTVRGGKWHATTVKYILENSIYQGIVSYSGHSSNKQKLALV